LRLEAVDTAAQDHIAAFETTTEGSTLLNARATFRPFGGERGVAVILDGRNLTDEDSHVHASFLKDELPRPGRNIRVVLQASF
jgi:iron complex outermembrane receptor protein